MPRCVFSARNFFGQVARRHIFTRKEIEESRFPHCRLSCQTHRFARQSPFQGLYALTRQSAHAKHRRRRRIIGLYSVAKSVVGNILFVDDEQRTDVLSETIEKNFVGKKKVRFGTRRYENQRTVHVCHRRAHKTVCPRQNLFDCSLLFVEQYVVADNHLVAQPDFFAGKQPHSPAVAENVKHSSHAFDNLTRFQSRFPPNISCAAARMRRLYRLPFCVLA